MQSDDRSSQWNFHPAPVSSVKVAAMLTAFIWCGVGLITLGC
jgi:hypothetical protein